MTQAKPRFRTFEDYLDYDFAPYLNWSVWRKAEVIPEALTFHSTSSNKFA
jgi:hypothetical protein